MSVTTTPVVAEKRPVNILLVDDLPAKLLSYETILAELGENLIRANSGKEGLEQLLKTDIAVVLVDVCMPDLDGFELAAMIRNHPRFQKTAIILVSGVLVEDADRLKGYGSGAVDYVSVPIVPEILRAKVSVFADLYRKTEELQQLNRELEQRVADRTAEIQSALKQAQDARLEAETANRLKDEFLATLSHELRTPLNAITGWAYLLQAGGLDKATEVKAFATIRRNAQLQSQLISDILDVSRIIAGKLRLNLEPTRMPVVIHAALDSLRPAADAKNIKVEAHLECDDSISADPGRLQQVVWNLLSNAIKFAPQDGLVRVTLIATDSHLETTVEDSGAGIRPEFLPYIFDRFRQADSSSTRPHHGLGLGLAIVKHLVQMHGGSVQAANREGKSGALFRVLLPRPATTVLSPSDGRAVSSVTKNDPGWEQSAPPLAGIRVLVVDDEPDGREVAAAILERCGAEARIAGSADEAIAMIEREPPHVLIADIEMPGQDGYELLRRVRALASEEKAQIPAAALTAYASTQDRLKVLKAGFQIHIAKPVHPVDLARAVASLAESREPDSD
ncbi:MAG: response regulator [Vicinamibacteria bacterium]